MPGRGAGPLGDVMLCLAERGRQLTPAAVACRPEPVASLIPIAWTTHTREYHSRSPPASRSSARWYERGLALAAIREAERARDAAGAVRFGLGASDPFLHGAGDQVPGAEPDQRDREGQPDLETRAVQRGQQVSLAVLQTGRRVLNRQAQRRRLRRRAERRAPGQRLDQATVYPRLLAFIGVTQRRSDCLPRCADRSQLTHDRVDPAGVAGKELPGQHRLHLSRRELHHHRRRVSVQEPALHVSRDLIRTDMMRGQVDPEVAAEPDCLLPVAAVADRDLRAGPARGA